MAASDRDPSTVPAPAGWTACLSAEALVRRLDEEINRAGRQGTPLSCLLVTIGNLEELSREHGAELAERTLEYVQGALRRQLRAFDRIGRPSGNELVVVLPGADGARGETVARRALTRLRTIKIEADGRRRPLRVSVGLADWREGVGSEQLVAQARAAARAETGVEAAPGAAATSPPALGRPGPS